MKGVKLTIALVFFGVLASGGQSFETIMKQSNQQNEQVRFLSLEVKMRVYATPQSDQVKEEKTGKVLKYGDSLYYNWDNFSMVSTPSWKLVVNSYGNRLAYYPEGTGKQDKKAAPRKMTDSLLNKYGSAFEKKGEDSIGLHYGGKVQKGYIRRMDVWVDPESYDLRKLVYYYDEEKTGRPYRVELDYSHFSRSREQVNTDYFIKKRYIRENEGSLKPSSRFSDFELKIHRP